MPPLSMRLHQLPSNTTPLTLRSCSRTRVLVTMTSSAVFQLVPEVVEAAEEAAAVAQETLSGRRSSPKRRPRLACPTPGMAAIVKVQRMMSHHMNTATSDTIALVSSAGLSAR